MKRAFSSFPFFFLPFFFICILLSIMQEVNAQPVSRPPIVVLAGNPQLIPVTITRANIVRATGNGTFTSYTTDDGLALDAVLCSSIDHFGNLWFGTQGGGACRYDGKSFVSFSTTQGLPDNNVWDIVEDRSGNLWFSTNKGLAKYDGHSFINYAVPPEIKNTRSLCLAEDHSGNIWWGIKGEGIIRFDGASMKIYTVRQGLINNMIRSIYTDTQGDVWLGTDGGVSKFDGKSFVNYTTRDGLAENKILSIKQDKNGIMWFGTASKGISKFDGKSFVNYSANDGLIDNSVKCILEDKEGNLWFGTDGGGVSKFDGTHFINYSKMQGLASDYIWDIVEDRVGNIWFITNGAGVCKFEGQGFTSFTSDQGLSNNIVWSIMEDEKGVLWFATNEGLTSYDRTVFTDYRASGANNTTISVIKDKNGKIWLGTLEGGVYCFDGKNFLRYTKEQGLAHHTVATMLIDGDGNVWFGTDQGISRFDGKTFTNYTTAQGLVNDLVNSSLFDSRGHFWFGTNNGLSFFDGQTFTNYTTAQGFTNSPIYDIFEDSTGALWFGTQQGAWYLAPEYAASPNKQRSVVFKRVTANDGLPDNYVAKIHEPEKGKLIVGTNMGIARFDRPDFNNSDLSLKGLEIFNSSLGYPVKDLNVGLNSMYQDRKGILWMGTGSEQTGLVRMEYSAVHHNLSPPLVTIQNIKINEELICWEYLKHRKASADGDTRSRSFPRLSAYDSLAMLISEFNAFGKTVPKDVLENQFKRFPLVQFDSITKYYSIPVNLVLPYKNNQISFEYAAIEPARPFMVRYQYILEGYDNDWNPVTTKTSATFGNIHEGTYTFRLKARSPYGVWSEPVSYTFRVLAPWWRSWWMYAVYVILGTGLIILITSVNSRRLRRKANELAYEVEKATAIILEQKQIVEEKNRNVSDSINYAQRIQNAILPEKNYIDQLFKDYFIYYQPKEIVSGDFYWFGEKDDKIIFASVDCTGHGVPGALMSMIGHSLLNEIIHGKGIKESDQILNQLRTNVIHVLKQKDTTESQKDGMDIAICVLDKKNKFLEFSGAYHSLYYVRNGVLNDIKGDMYAIGFEKREQQPFTRHRLDLLDGDTIYLCTDGFADQKGGPEKKKFFQRQFRQLLESLHTEELPKQKMILHETFINWKGNLEQIDDVLVIGIRL